ncbi:MAG: exodeoxyribonuclease [Thermoleophilaceae bacterium]|nr:exodeoxyribonuclease [Thermoleophilaceae bacterium]
MIAVSWNVAGRVRSVPEQAAALLAEPSDVVCLQEIRLTSLAAWRAELGARGYSHVLSSLDGVPPGARLAPDRRLGVLVAARVPLAPASAPDVPWHERVLAVTVDGIELLNLHAPISTKPEQVKVRTLEAVFEHLAAPSEAPRIFVGDLNTPQYESREGEVSSFARTRSGRIRPLYGERHDAAELSVVVGLLEHGWVDAFRVLHGYGRRDRSWMYAHAKMGYRLDHVLVRGLTVTACEYRHDLRERGLSDHSAIWAEVERTSV